MESTPIPPFLIFARSDRPIVRLRRYLVPAKWRQERTLRWKLGFAGVVLGWPLIATYFASSANRQYGALVRQLTGRARWRQFIEQLWIACWFGVAPQAYYKYGLFDAERRAAAGDYLHNQDLFALFSALKVGDDMALFEDKGVFDQACATVGLPRVAALAVFEDGRLTRGTLKTPEDLPASDLFAKPTDQYGGMGACCFEYLEPGLYRQQDHQRLTRQDLFALLIEQSKRRPYVLQPRVQNHTHLQNLSSGALCTLRMMTGRRVSGEIILLTAIFRMGVEAAVVDNFTAGGIACPVDEADGRLGSAAPKRPIARRFDRHPDTGHAITGVVLPHWHEAVRLSLKAHELLTPMVYVGWDVAITDEGPVLIEVNESPCLEMFQKGGDQPVGGSRFNAFCLEHFDAIRKRSSHVAAS